jgi:geranylgeranyl diphosphate synthase type II
MHNYNELLDKVKEYIADITYNHEPSELYEPIEYIMSLGGKRIRPVIALMSCEMFGEKYEKAIDAAVGMEMFHNFTLVHDDIMDRANVRRGEPTVHVKWDENRALLSGDAMIILANKMMLDVDDDVLREVMDLYNETGIKVCDGQQYDMNFESRDVIQMDEYLRMIELKTAKLIAGCLRLGAVVAKTTEKNKSLIEDFGMNLGISFQIEDDLLDSFGDFESFGKKIGGDILINKKTFLLVKSMELADESKLKEINYWLNQKDYNPNEKINAILEIYNQYNIKEIALKESTLYFDKAMKSLADIEVHESKKEELKKFAYKLIRRAS